ncbi:hypothetical protein DF186_20315, partial [Enterococcus hirae]
MRSGRAAGLAGQGAAGRVVAEDRQRREQQQHAGDDRQRLRVELADEGEADALGGMGEGVEPGDVGQQRAALA